MPKFSTYVGIDYSGARLPKNRIEGLSVFIAQGKNAPNLLTNANKNWSREELANWIISFVREEGDKGNNCILGIDHGFSFPQEYFIKYNLISKWDDFLKDFEDHWPVKKDTVYNLKDNSERTGNAKWFRLTEEVAKKKYKAPAKSVFNFEGPGVAYSTHAGLPWLLFLRKSKLDIHFWPFDGWDLPDNKSVIVEVYPRVFLDFYKESIDFMDLNEHQIDAFCSAKRLQEIDQTGELEKYLNPTLSKEERSQAELEGWIFGVC